MEMTTLAQVVTKQYLKLAKVKKSDEPLGLIMPRISLLSLLDSVFHCYLSRFHFDIAPHSFCAPSKHIGYSALQLKILFKLLDKTCER